MAKLFVWDFHGVLEKGNERAVVEVTNQVLEEFGIKNRLDLKKCVNHGKKWHLFFRHLAPNADESTIKAMVERGIEISTTTDVLYRHTEPMDYACEVLGKIKDKGHENLILSNANQGPLEIYVDAVKIAHLINHIIGADVHTRLLDENTKIAIMNEFLKSRDYEKIIVIGDNHSDIELGKAIGAVTFHFRRDGKFDSSDADFRITDLREVVKNI